MCVYVSCSVSEVESELHRVKAELKKAVKAAQDSEFKHQNLEVCAHVYVNVCKCMCVCKCVCV